MEEKLKWHAAFYGATELDFDEDRECLVFESEVPLSKEPLRMDLNIVKKITEQTLKNEIGAIFRKYNIFEYKSPEDHLSIDDFYKVIAYASLYKSQGRTVDERPAEEITISLFRERYPRKLIAELTKEGYAVKKAYPGIYYVTGKLMFATQIVVSKQLKGHISYKALSSSLTEEDAVLFIKKSNEWEEQGQHNNADAVYAVSVAANYEVYDRIRRRNPIMCEALRELMKEEIEKEKDIAIREGLAKGHAEGRAEGERKAYMDMVKEGMISVSDAAKKLQMSEEEFRKIAFESIK